MNPTNVIYESCGRDVIVEPEVMDDDEATCPMCRSTLFYDQKKELYDHISAMLTDYENQEDNFDKSNINWEEEFYQILVDVQNKWEEE